MGTKRASVCGKAREAISSMGINKKDRGDWHVGMQNGAGIVEWPGERPDLLGNYFKLNILMWVQGPKLVYAS